ncbi:hypothetical protein N7486_011096 [Penicillium sp. IBT 16267x]|nr:hypothetical protein N7486_011096 [Penicillium sp. IBT 16267x]
MPPDRTRAGQTPTSQIKSQRTLACVNCQQRKIKCDREFPCANCLKQRTRCVPATQTRPRKRRFPERELLSRLRKYEDLLRQNNVRFDPLHKDSGTTGDEGGESSEEEQQSQPNHSSPTRKRPESTYEPKNLWQAMSQGLRHGNKSQGPRSEGIREAMVRMSWDQCFENDDHIILGSRKASVDLATMHPEPVHIIRLWQLYLENVDPLFKVTHTPSLQGKVIEAATNTMNIEPKLEALIFSIYCIAIQSLTEEICQSIFGFSKADLLTKYQFGCQQALLNCQFLRTDTRTCLTALFLFLFSLHANTNPQSLSSLLGIAIRIAQRMGIHSETFLAKHSVFEAEMSRRLWWSLVMLHARMGELSGAKSSIMNPTWNCNPPLNINDSDLWVEMKEPPAGQGKATEAIFPVLRSELANHIRHSPFHLEFLNPALKPIARELPNGGDVATFEKRIEDEYLRYCDQENPLHFMTIWTIRAQISKSYLLERYARYSDSLEHRNDTESDASMAQALRLLECDTKILTSSLTKGYAWILQIYFPFPAYIHIVQDLKKRPGSNHTKKAWQVMNENYEVRFNSPSGFSGPLFAIFARLILEAWEALETTSKQTDAQVSSPKIVLNIKQRLAEMTKDIPTPNSELPDDALDSLLNQTPMPMPMGMGLGMGTGTRMGFGNESLLSGMAGQVGFPWSDPRLLANIPGQPPMPYDINQLNWVSMVWGLREARGW